MKTVAFVPIKLNNERTPGKNTKSFSDGTPLMKLIQRTLMKCKTVDEVYVYCSNEGVQVYLEDGVKFLKRNPRFDDNYANVNEMFYEFSKIVDADIYVLAHATAPFLLEQSIDKGVQEVQKGEFDSAIAVEKQQEFFWNDGRPINYDVKNIPRTQDLPVYYMETTGMYIFTKEVIQQQHSRIGKKPYLVEVSKIEAVDINYPIDFEIADAIYTNSLHKLGGGIVKFPFIFRSVVISAKGVAA